MSASVGPGADGGSWKRVLVVDADDDTRVILGAALEASGYRPLLASEVQGAFALAASSPVHLIISESMAIGTPDLPASLRASPALARVPMIVYSSRAFPGDVERSLLAGASVVLVKPVPYRIIIGLVDRLVVPTEVPPAPPLPESDQPRA